jgi:hypothetical protein
MIEETDDKLVYAQVKKYLDKMDNIKSTWQMFSNVILYN